MLTVIVALNTAMVALLTLLVAGLLRSHADIQGTLARITSRPGKTGGMLSPDIPLPPEREHVLQAGDITGVTPSGDSLCLALSAGGRSTLLAFLTSGCATCATFWEAFATIGDLPGGSRLIVITKGPEEESPSRLADLAPPALPVILSSDAWEVFEVPGAPYFVYVDGPSGQVHGEGAAVTWDQVRSLLADAIYDAQRGSEAAETVQMRQPESTYERQCRADTALAAAGIEPDDRTFFDRVNPEPEKSRE